MKRLLSIAGQGSAPIHEAFGDWERTLNEAEVDWNINWIDPNGDRRKVDAAGKNAIAALGAVGSWDQRVQRMSVSFRRFRQPRPQAPRWVGWVSRQGDQFVATLATATDNQPLYVLRTNKQSKQVSMVPITSGGLKQTNGSSILISNPEGQSCGAMICIVPSSAQSTPQQNRSS